ncbi:hypothetical protein [Paracoccus pacificus]|uniref:Secreted protein n=1 Tax=Paracoccus pacificus TaxID=1463598 RepID=A0ABW4R4T8_9RHOB
MARPSFILFTAAVPSAEALIMWRCKAAPTASRPKDTAIASGRNTRPRTATRTAPERHGADPLRGKDSLTAAPSPGGTGDRWHQADALLDQIVGHGAAPVAGIAHENSGGMSRRGATTPPATMNSTKPGRNGATKSRFPQDDGS